MVCVVASSVTESTPSESVNAVDIGHVCLSVHHLIYLSRLPSSEVSQSLFRLSAAGGGREARVMISGSTTHAFVEQILCRGDGVVSAVCMSLHHRSRLL